MLTPDDLAYMRETQTETRPTEAQLQRRIQGATPSGGRSDAYQADAPVDVRIDGQPQNVPGSVIAVMGGGKPVKITMDLVECRSGDLIQVSATEVYQIVTDGDPTDWTTAQIVWAKRTKRPAR